MWAKAEEADLPIREFAQGWVGEDVGLVVESGRRPDLCGGIGRGSTARSASRSIACCMPAVRKRLTQARRAPEAHDGSLRHLPEYAPWPPPVGPLQSEIIFRSSAVQKQAETARDPPVTTVERCVALPWLPSSGRSGDALRAGPQSAASRGVGGAHDRCAGTGPGRERPSVWREGIFGAPVVCGAPRRVGRPLTGGGVIGGGRKDLPVRRRPCGAVQSGLAA
jgi:hypothetical protein